MFRLIARYVGWLHTRWPAGTVEPLPEVREHGRTSIPGVYVAGDLTGIPLLKFALDSGARVARDVARDPAVGASRAADVEPEALRGDRPALDLVIVGAGVAGMAAAVEARRSGLRFEVLEATEPFSTLVNFPRAKPIFTYPRAMTPTGQLQVTADVKEGLVEELRAQVER
ncbi:MAG: FAD-binding protein, partial [Candidatus Eiseniibacteriota bacterium]